MIARHGLQRLEEHPGRQRQVEEDMRDQNAGKAVNSGPPSVRQQVQRRGQKSASAIEGQHPKRHDDRRQRLRHGKKTQERLSAEKTLMARYGARHEQRRKYGQHRGKESLKQCEPDNSGKAHIEVGGRQSAGTRRLQQKAGNRAAAQQRRKRQRHDPGPSPANGAPFPSRIGDRFQWPIASSHSSTQAFLFSATSSAPNSRVLDGLTSLPKTGWSGLPVLPAGNIQLVSGMMS